MDYTYIQKMSIVRVLLDIISVDGKIDARETHFFEEIKVKLDLSAEDHFRVREYNTLNCLSSRPFSIASRLVAIRQLISI